MLYLPLTPTLFDELLAMGYTTSIITKQLYKELVNAESKCIWVYKTGYLGMRLLKNVPPNTPQITLEQAQSIKILLSLGFNMQDAYKQVSKEKLIDSTTH